MIQAENLTKVYRIADKEPGLGGAVRHLFRPRHKSKTAVKDVNPISLHQFDTLIDYWQRRLPLNE